MTLIKKLISALVAVVAVSAAVAQQIPAPTQEGPGLIGKSVAALGFSYTDVRHTSNDAYAATISVNAPATSNLDISTSYTYDWQEAHASNDIHTLRTSAVLYYVQGNIKPFAKVTIGYMKPDYADNSAFGSRLIWGGDVGFETALCSKAALTVSGGYEDDFKSHTDKMVGFKGNVGTNYWLTKDLVATAGISLLERGHVSFGLGLGMRF